MHPYVHQPHYFPARNICSLFCQVLGRERKRCCEHNIGNLWKLRLERKIMNFWAFSKFLYGITPPPPTYFTEEKSYQITKEEEAGVINPENCSWQFFRSNYKSILCRKSFFQFHGVWKSQKSLIQHCERSELRLHFE